MGGSTHRSHVSRGPASIRSPSVFGHFVPEGGHLKLPREDRSPGLADRVAASRLGIGGAILRRWDPSDAELLDAALALSRPELLAWTPWVLEGVGDSLALRERLKGYRDAFDSGGNRLYAVMDPQESAVWGGAGLYKRVGEGALEIGYWIRSDRTGQGLATQASQRLIEVGFGSEGVQRMEIHCRSDNVASIKIPQKLGFELRETHPGMPGRPGQTEVWELPRSAWKGRRVGSSTVPDRA